MMPWFLAGLFCVLWLLEHRGRMELRDLICRMLVGASAQDTPGPSTVKRIPFTFPDMRCADCGKGLSLFEINGRPTPFYCQPCGNRRAAAAEHAL